MTWTEPIIIERLRTGESVIASLTVSMIVAPLRERKWSMSYGPEGAIALTPNRLLFAGSQKRQPVVEWSVDLDDVTSAAYYPFTLNIWTKAYGETRFPVGGYSRGDPAREWAAKVRELVGPLPEQPNAPAILEDWQTKRLIELRRQRRDGEMSEAQFERAKRSLLE